jgi:hypothetical protein
MRDLVDQVPETVRWIDSKTLITVRRSEAVNSNLHA